MVVRIRTLTPLWTGGVDGTMDRIHETGILGSLRWWYEAIARGLGGSACDPTKHEHELSGQRLKRYEQARREGKGWWAALDEAGICDACKVFGTTGWRRRFRLEVRPVEGEIDLTEGMFPSGRVHSDRRGGYRVGGWLLRGGCFGTLELRFIGEERVLLCEILPTLLFIEQWGALGPKTSIGYGVIEITNLQIGKETYNQTQGDWRVQLKGFMTQKCQGSRLGKWWWFQEIPPVHSPYQGVLPALTNMFFSKVRFEVTDSTWWNKFREIQWLQSGGIDENGAHWKGREEKPPGPFVISNPLPVCRIKHWVRCHDVFPLAPIVRTRFRYGDAGIGVCTDSNGESDWCKFVFGTVHGNGPVCGYCGTKVRRGRNNQSWWCSNGHASLADHEVFNGKRIQSKVRVSWAYRVGDNKWELRLWGWLPEQRQSDNHQQKKFLDGLKQSIENLLQRLSLSQTQSSLRCWVERSGETHNFFENLLEGCQEYRRHGE